MNQMGLVSSFLLFSAIPVYFSNPSNGLTCTKDPDSLCKCHLSDGAEGTIDLSNLFSGGPVKASRCDYKYILNGCRAVYACTGCTGDCLACQTNLYGSQEHGIGGSSDVSFDVSASDPSNSLWRINVTYGGGAGGRHCSVLYEHSATTTFTFIVESPQLFYHMKLSGNFSVPGDSGSGSVKTDVGRNLPAYLGGAAAGVVGLIVITLTVLLIICTIAVRRARRRHRHRIEMIIKNED